MSDFFPQDRVVYFSCVPEESWPTRVDALPTRPQQLAGLASDDDESSGFDGEEEVAPKHYPTRGKKQPARVELTKKKSRKATRSPYKQGGVVMGETGMHRRYVPDASNDD